MGEKGLGEGDCDGGGVWVSHVPCRDPVPPQGSPVSPPTLLAWLCPQCQMPVEAEAGAVARCGGTVRWHGVAGRAGSIVQGLLLCVAGLERSCLSAWPGCLGGDMGGHGGQGMGAWCWRC